MLIGLKNQNKHGIGFVSCNRSGRWISVNIFVLIFMRWQCLHISEMFEYAGSVLLAAAVRNAHRSAVLRHIHFAGRSVCDTPDTAENCISELSRRLCRYDGYSRGITVHMKM